MSRSCLPTPRSPRKRSAAQVLIPTAFPGLPKSDIVQTAQSVADLSTLVTAVVTANVTAALSMPNGPYTGAWPQRGEGGTWSRAAALRGR